MRILEYGLYNVKDEYFDDFRSDYLPDNKQENRPYYYAVKDTDGIIWLIPISSQVVAYRAKIEKDIAKRGECLYYHIGKLKGREHVFQIGNMFPVTEKYIKKPFSLQGSPYTVQDETLKKALHKRFKKFLRLIQQGKLTPNVDILAIKQELLKH